MLGLDISMADVVVWLIMILIAFPVHELAHAIVADRFGDDTPRMNGRLTINPLAHLDPIGALLMLVAHFGWAKPVPVNPYALARRSPLALMWVSLAGPLSNLLMAILGAIPLRFNLVQYTPVVGASFPSLFEILYYFVSLNLILFLFNLIPIAPLDGSKIAVAILPESWGQAVERFSTYGPIVLLLVAFVGPQIGLPILSWIINPVMNNLITLLIGA
jgi:Zn-dependent protease